MQMTSAPDTMSAPPLPARIFAEGFANGRQTPEAKAVAAALAAAGVPQECIITATEAQFTRDHLKTLTSADMAVGNPNFVRLALQQLRVPIPEPPDYPACLSCPLTLPPRTRTHRNHPTMRMRAVFLYRCNTRSQPISSSAKCSRAPSTTLLRTLTAILPPPCSSNRLLKPKHSTANASLVPHTNTMHSRRGAPLTLYSRERCLVDPNMARAVAGLLSHSLRRGHRHRGGVPCVRGRRVSSSCVPGVPPATQRRLSCVLGV